MQICPYADRSPTGVSHEFLESFAPQILSILRIVAGLLFLEHRHRQAGAFSRRARCIAAADLRWHRRLAGIIELVAGALIALGLFSRYRRLHRSGEMAVAYFLAIGMSGPHSFFPAHNGGDAAILFCFIFLYLAAAGPGPFAINQK